MEVKGIRRILDIYENKTKTMEEIIQKLIDLRDATPCDEESHKLCGCEKFDEIIDDLINLNN